MLTSKNMVTFTFRMTIALVIYFLNMSCQNKAAIQLGGENRRNSAISTAGDEPGTAKKPVDHDPASAESATRAIAENEEDSLRRAAKVAGIQMASLEVLLRQYSEAQTTFRATVSEFSVFEGNLKISLKAKDAIAAEFLASSPDDFDTLANILYLAKKSTSHPVVAKKEGKIGYYIVSARRGDGSTIVVAKVDPDQTLSLLGLGTISADSLLLIDRLERSGKIRSLMSISLDSKSKGGIGYVISSKDGSFYVSESVTYKSGVRHGFEQTFHPSGSLKSKVLWQKGLREGKSIAYHDNGKISRSGQYTNGRKNGRWLSFNSSGEQLDDEMYRDGKWDGLVKRNMFLYLVEETYALGKRVGLTTERSVRTGKKISEYFYKEKLLDVSADRDIFVTYWTGEKKSFDEETGNLLSTSTIGEPMLVGGRSVVYKKMYVKPYESGTIKSRIGLSCIIEVKDDGFYYRIDDSDDVCKNHGPAVTFYPSGLVESTAKFDNGKIVGDIRSVWQNGKTKTINKYDGDGNLHGISETYFESGRIESRTNYVNGKTEGRATEFFENGKLSKEGVLKGGDEPGKSLWVEFIEYYDSGLPKKQCDFRSNRCVQWDIKGDRLDIAH